MVEDVDFVLELGALGAELVRGRLAVVLDFGAEFGTGGAEEVGFLFFCRAVSDCGRRGRRSGEGDGTYVLDVGFAHEAFFCDV